MPQKVVIAYQTAEGRNIAQYMADTLKASTGYELSLIHIFLTWQNPEQLFVAQVLIKTIKL